jgi:hypothetical protein
MTKGRKYLEAQVKVLEEDVDHYYISNQRLSAEIKDYKDTLLRPSLYKAFRNWFKKWRNYR